MSFEQLKEEYLLEVTQSRKKTRKTFLWIYGILYFIFIFVYLAFEFDLYALIGFSLSMVALLLLTLFLISKFNSQKAFFKIVAKNAYNDLLLDFSLDHYQYSSYPKDKDQILQGNFFTKHATYDLKYKIDFENNDSKYTIYRPYIYTQSDKSRYVYLDGLYIILDYPENNVFQLRTKGKPRSKDLELVHEKNEEYSLFLEPNLSGIPSKYTTIFKQIKRIYPKSNVFISSNKTQIHIGYDIKKMRLNIKELTYDSYQTVISELKEDFLVIHDILQNF